MTPLISTPEDAARLRLIAQSWVGTPWTADGAVKGTGASCSMLPYAVLTEFGHASPTPPSRRDVLKCEIMRVMETWMREKVAFFVPVEIPQITAGDVLLINCGIGHMALATGGTEILHSWQTTGAHFAQYTERTILKRLEKAWRPIRHE